MSRHTRTTETWQDFDPVGGKERALTDYGNAERFADDHGERVRWCGAWNRWLFFDGKRWAMDDTGTVERWMKATVRGIYAEAAGAGDSRERKAIADHAKKSESARRITDALRLARSEPGIPIKPGELDADPWLLNVENGTLELRTGELREHRREDMITKLAPVDYDPDAEAPRFEEFLAEIFAGDEDLVAFVQRFAGYSFTGSTEERCFAILHGRGKNGKSTLVELLREAMGDYASTTETETILAKRYQGVGNDVAALKGARFVAAAEVERDRYLAESKVKNLTGSDTVSARFLYAEPFEFRPEFKLWLSTNNKPAIRGDDDAIWDRIKLIPFGVRFEGADADMRLPEKLREELPGVLAWMVRGCLQWQREGLGDPEKVKTATAGYRAEMDVLAAFIEERCVLGPNAWAKFSDLYESYTDWCVGAGETAEKKRSFGTRLKERGFEPDKGTDNVAIRRGIGLLDNRRPDPEGDSTVILGDEDDPTVIPEDTHTYEESDAQNYSNYPNYPENDNFSQAFPREGSLRKEGNYDNLGNSTGYPEGWQGKLNAMLEQPERWMFTRRAQVHDPGSGVSQDSFASAVAAYLEVPPEKRAAVGNLVGARIDQLTNGEERA